jgi:OmpA-OmpF porin, OOP family
MKKILVLLTVISTISIAGNAQFNNILNKVKNKSKQRADQKVDQAIDKTLDQVEGKKTTTSGNNNNNAATGNTEAAAPAEEPALKSFSKYDFIPGDSIIYYDSFEGEALSELPTAWNTSGTGEVTTFEKYPGNWLRMHKPFTYLSSNQKDFGENYTVEFDIILQLKNTGWMYPEIRFGLFATKDESTTGNNFLTDYRKNAAVIAHILPGEFKSSKVRVNSYLENRAWFKGDAKEYAELEKTWGTPVHVAIQVQKERFRMWINEAKVFDVPKGVPPGVILNQLMFEVGSTNYADNQYGIYVSNIKVATGRPDTRHKLIEEGKFSTTGILFDFQSAVIKPESYAVVKEIATVLKENGSIKVKVLGHTSSDGDDNANMELSKKRAAAVKELLTTEFGIDASRIETEGMGETQPVADNKTKEGKMLNRRVEFVKL